MIRTLFSSLLAVALLTGCDALSGAKDKTAAEEAMPLPVEIAAVRRGDINAVYSGTAALEVEAQAQVKAKVAGEIIELLVEEGDSVTRDQVLARLDGDRLRLEVQRQSASVRQVEQDYQRNLELHEKGLVSAGAFEGMKYELEALRAALRLAQLELSYTQIRAPFDGVVSERHVKRGNTVTVNQNLFTITDLDPLLAYLHAPEKEFNKLRAGQQAAIEVDALPGKLFFGSIARISPVVDPGTGTFKVTVVIGDDSGALKPGMFGRINVIYDRRDDALLVPRSALVDSDTETAVFVVADGVAERRTVRLGYASGAEIEVVEGLQGDERIVVVGQNSLKDGGQVRIIGPEPPDTRTVVEQTLTADPAG